jgi:hypothetical protein
VRRAILGIAVTLACAGCGLTSPGVNAPTTDELRVEASPSAYTEITAGPVRAMIPDGWQPVATSGDAREGFYASPSPARWSRMDGTTEGITATWVDATQIGVPSDFYYLAATGPLFSRLIDSPGCRAESQQVFLDDSPTFVSGETGSFGDYMARGEGTCSVHGLATRWAYFVAAPGFGPVRRLGIPRSGLYVVVAVLQDRRGVDRALQRLIDRTRFGGAGIRDFVRAASARAAKLT